MLVSDYRGAAKDQIRELLADVEGTAGLRPEEMAQLTASLLEALRALEDKSNAQRAAWFLGRLSNALRSGIPAAVPGPTRSSI